MKLKLGFYVDQCGEIWEIVSIYGLYCYKDVEISHDTYHCEAIPIQTIRRIFANFEYLGK